MMGRTDSQKLFSGLHMHFVLSVDRQTDRFLKGGRGMPFCNFVQGFRHPSYTIIFCFVYTWVFVFILIWKVLGLEFMLYIFT